MKPSVENIDLIKRLDDVERPAIDRTKRIQREYQSTKNSPDYYKRNAVEKLEKIVKNSEYEEFVNNIKAISNVFSSDEYKEIARILDELLNSKEKYDNWKCDHCIPLIESSTPNKF